MKTTTDPYDMADTAWDDTHAGNFALMSERIITIIAEMDPPCASAEEFLARVMELSWKTGFACGLDCMSHGHIMSFPLKPGGN